MERIDYLAEIEHRDRSNMIVHILSMYVESLEAERKAWENSER
ncbi:MAG: hypothetical protein GX098_01570 [Bacteroidales bacterium]|nr:hypothetical protein [Bacteroidales bacterium]